MNRQIAKQLWTEKWEIDSWDSKWEFADWQIAVKMRICWLADCSEKSQNWPNEEKSNSETLLIMIWIKIRQNRWLLSTEKSSVWWWDKKRKEREKDHWLKMRLLSPHFSLFLIVRILGGADRTIDERGFHFTHDEWE